MYAYDNYAQAYIRKNYKTMRIKDIATHLDKSPKAITEWLRRRGLVKNKRWGEMELYLLENFNLKAKGYINRSENALRIKMYRLKT